jgi:hypothetical protein
MFWFRWGRYCGYFGCRFWLSKYVLFFLWYDFIVFPYHQFQDRTFNLISFIGFHVFQHLSLLFSHFRFLVFFSWLCFDLNVLHFNSFFCGAFFMDFLDFVGGAQMRCAPCFVCMEASLLRTYCGSWGTMYTVCTHCGITPHPEMLFAFSRSRHGSHMFTR